MNYSLFLFNPDNDLALANGDENFMPSRQCRRMAEDLAYLPMWYASDNSRVLVPFLSSGEFIPKEVSRIVSDIYPVDKEGMDLVTYSEIISWGWNRMLVKQLRLLGVTDNLLPSNETIQRIRDYSHRSYSVLLLKELLGSDWLCGSAACLYTDDEVKSFVERNEACVLKAPWSGSGKGLFWTKGEYNYLLKQWSARVIKRQHCIVGEIHYNKVEDFAMEFYSDGCGKVTFAGYSLFHTDKHGTYKRNVLASDTYILGYLSKYVGVDLFLELQTKLEHHLSLSIGAFYRGYMGVDMMVCLFPDTPYYRIHPCVEVNLRMSMGMVSRLIYDRYISPGARGYFSVDYYDCSTDLYNGHKDNLTAFPLVIRDGKVNSGYLSLTPVYPYTHYQASLKIEPCL